MTVYKIRNRATGLFSTGGAYPRWTKMGKTWSNLGPLRLHLGMFVTHRGEKLTFGYKAGEAEVVALEVSDPIEAGTVPLEEMLGAIADRKRERWSEWEERWKKARVKRLEELEKARARAAE